MYCNKYDTLPYKRPEVCLQKWVSKGLQRASLVVQWIRICLPMRRIQVQSLVQEDPTCRGAPKPVRHNY